MGDRTWTGISFSGTIKGSVADELIEELDGQGCKCDDGPEGDLSRAHLLIPHQTFYDDECNYAEMEGVEGFCRENGISYLKTWMDGGGYPGGYKLYSAATDTEFEVEGRDEVHLSLGQLKEMKANSNTLDDAIRFLEHIEKFSENYPALEIVD